MQELLDFEQEQVPQRVFLGWDAPLLQSVTSWLLAGENRSELASSLVLVPTANSGRRLRRALSEGGGILAPHVSMPSRLFEVDGVASRQESLWAWLRVIQGAGFDQFPNLFRNHEAGATAGFGVALAMARQLLTLRNTLADAGQSFRDAGFHSPEKERWAELGELESLMLKQLGQWKLRDPVLAMRERATSPTLPPGVSRVVLACVPDPSLLALRAMQSHLAGGIPITVLIHAPAAEQQTFDHWGIPDADYWTSRKIDIPDWQQRLHVVDSPLEAAETCLSVLGEQQTPAEDTALALCDPTFEPALDKAFTAAGWPLYKPEGMRMADSGIVSLLRVMRDLSGRNNAFEALRELVRLPGSEMFLPANTSRHQAAELMDKLHLQHLPDTVPEAELLASAKQRSLLKSVSSRLEELARGKLGETLRKWLGVWLQQTDPDVAKAAEAALAEAVDAVDRLETQGEPPAADEAFEMLAESLQSARVPMQRSGSVLDLQGWLEISYDPAPHLVLAGMHEECVPDGAADDVFVPDSLREELGLRSVRERFGRDAFLFQSALAWRSNGGRVDAVVARFTQTGEARKPSRLLMRQSGENLAAVVHHLFGESSRGSAIQGAWQRDWTLRVPARNNPYAEEPPRHLSPSAIGDYLDCPLRFYLKRIVNMESHDAGKQEMDALDFGNLCHRVLEQFGADEHMRESVDAGEIESCFSTRLDAEMRRLYGSNLSLPLMVQLESARERLRAFAPVQAEDRAAGWRIVATEFRVGTDDVSWRLAGHPVTMMIDRIDRHEDGVRWRVWDYKTSGKAKNPGEVHLEPWRDSENRPLLGELMQGGRTGRRWANVQLPMYAAFVRDHFKTGELPQVGYINLPRAVSEVAFAPWADFDQMLLDHAMSWAEAAVEKISSGEFSQAASYPANKRDWDDFAELAPDGLDKAFGLGGTR